MKNLNMFALKKGCVINTNREIVFTENCEYYHQVQGQKGLYCMNTSHLALNTKSGICVVHAYFDRDVYKRMLYNMPTFCA